MTDKNREFVIFLKKKPKLKILSTTGIGMLILPVFGYKVITELFPEKFGMNWITLAFLLCFFLVFEYLLIKTFLWLYRGQEKITMNANSLRIEKIGSILDFPTTYKLEKIKTFSLAEKKTLQDFFNRSDLSGGKIQFIYFGETIKFGQSLTRIEAEAIIRKLNEEKETTNR